MKIFRTFYKIIEWLFIATASFVATTAGLNGDYSKMIWVILAILFCIASSGFKFLLEEREKELEELSDQYDNLVEENLELMMLNKALVEQQSLSDSNQTNNTES